MFGLEVLLKLSVLRLTYFRDSFNQFDLLLVVGMIVSLIMDGELWMLMLSLKPLRLLYSLRIFGRGRRLRAIVEALITIIMSLEVLVQYAAFLLFALIPFSVWSTIYIGRASEFSSNPTDEGTSTNTLWGTFSRSCLSWFQIATLDWGDIVRPVIEIRPSFVIPFLLYIFLVGIGASNVFITIIGDKYEQTVEAVEGDTLMVVPPKEDSGQGQEDGKASPTETASSLELTTETSSSPRKLMDRFLKGEFAPEEVYNLAPRLSNTDLAYLLLRSRKPLP